MMLWSSYLIVWILELYILILISKLEGPDKLCKENLNYLYRCVKYNI